MNLLPLAVLILSTCAALLVVPDLRSAELIEPAVGAALGTPFVLTVLVVARVAGWPAVVERGVLAAFLFLMPTVYLGSLALHGGAAPWPIVEVAGQVVFAVVAVVGFRWSGSGWVLAAGIVAHGLLWDLWHHGRTTFIPDWYTVACLLVDVGWGFYAFSRVAAWNAEDRARVRRGSTGDAAIAPLATAR